MGATSKIKSNKKLFISGVAILTFANIFNKIMGLLYRIPISNQLGDTGMAYFNAAFHIYVWFYMLSTGGLPIAVSMMISEARFKGKTDEIKRIYKISMRLFIVIGIIGTAFMILLSSQFSQACGMEDKAALSIIAIAPTLFFVCVSSALRGFFQGYQEMFPTAISQILETVGKLVVGVLLAGYAINSNFSLKTTAAFAIAGLTIGTMAGTLFLMISKVRFKEDEYNAEFLEQAGENHEVRGVWNIVKTLIVIAIPVTISSSLMSFTTMIDDMIINRRLMSIGFTVDAANALYGNYTALAVPFANMPPVLIYPISYSLIPILRGNLATGNREGALNMCQRALKMAALIAIPCSIGLCVLSEPILNLIYSAERSALAAPKLSVLSLSVFFICMLSVTDAILQAHGKEKLPIISMLSGCSVKLITNYILIGIPAIGIYGAPISTFLCYFVITAVNVFFMSKYTDVTPAVIKTFFRPLLASIVCMAASFASYWFLSGVMNPKIATLVAILTAFVVYVFAVLLLGAVNRDDLSMLPKGDKIYSVMHKLHLMK